LAEDPEKAFSGNGNKYKDQARIAELERLLGQAHAEIELLKKAFAMTQKKVREERIKPMLRDGI
jgi:transposase